MKKIFLIILPILILLISGCKQEKMYIEGCIIDSVSLTKSRYLPNEEVYVNVKINSDNSIEELDLLFEVYHLNELIDSSLYAIESQNFTFSWLSINDDYQGYLGKVSIKKGNEILDVETIGIDISSDWSLNPRYGFLSSYSNLSANQIEETLDELAQYHITGLQFYDWQYKHHLPYDLNMDDWFDIANKLVEAEIIENYINEAHKRNIYAMNYNLIFGTYEDFLDDDVKLEWGLFKDRLHNVLDYHPLPSTWASSKIYLMNPNNSEWRNYILEKEKLAFNKFAFDGWHMDQLGNRGNTFTFEGTLVDLQYSYSDFIDFMDEELDKKIVFNIVNNYGMLDVLLNPNQEFIYTELWDNITYNDIANTIKMYKNISNKPVVIAAYMNYDMSSEPGFFNTPSILLTDATIFSFGGTHIELGDHGMLGNEYFPNSNLKMTNELKITLKDYYDFQVAYQNLLVENNEYTTNKVIIEDFETSNNGLENTIWYHSTSNDDYQIVHLINLLQNENDWRDNNGTKTTPNIINDFEVKYYLDDDIEAVYMASPDFLGGLVSEIDFKIKSDENGKYIIFEVEHLKYWNMIIMEK